MKYHEIITFSRKHGIIIPGGQPKKQPVEKRGSQGSTKTPLGPWWVDRWSPRPWPFRIRPASISGFSPPLGLCQAFQDAHGQDLHGAASAGPSWQGSAVQYWGVNHQESNVNMQAKYKIIHGDVTSNLLQSLLKKWYNLWTPGDFSEWRGATKRLSRSRLEVLTRTSSHI